MTAPFPPAGKRPRVLLVDDNQSFRVVLTHMLMDFFEVSVAENGEHAMKLITERRYDIVLTDVDMPTMDGAELANAMLADSGLAGFTKTQRIRRAPPVVVMTGMDDDDPRMRKLKFAPHVVAVLKKPIDYEKLIALIESILNGDTQRPPMEQSAT